MLPIPSSDRSGKARDPEEVRRAITAEVTRLIAAFAIAHKEFPQADDLPRLAQIPYHHLGHQVLLDYDRFASILWGTVHEIQKTIRGNPWRTLAPLVAVVLAGLSILVGVFLVSGTRDPTVIHIAPTLVGFVLTGFIYSSLRLNYEKVVAEIRARNLRKLLHEVEPESAEEFRRGQMAGRHLAPWGDGHPGGGKTPVLVLVNDQNPFPGYGRHQARELYICRPEDDKPPPGLSAKALNTAVSDALVQMAQNAGLSCVTAGKVVLIDGRTLRRGSVWLPTRKDDSPGASGKKPDFSPPRYVLNDDLASVESRDPNASVRIYTCIQAVVPEYLMCVTFFIRTFLAGNSAACEVNVTTLGPPLWDWDYIRERLRVYDREKKGDSSAAYRKSGMEDEIQEPKDQTALGAQLAAIRFGIENHSTEFKSRRDKSDVMRIKAFDAEALAHERRQADRIAEGSEQWPGVYTRPGNWREHYSLTFTNDFFGNTESRAILKTLYDRICRSALNQLKELGYDVSDYQDENGRFTLKAERIEQVIVGERVFVEPRARQAEKQIPKGSSSEAKA